MKLWGANHEDHETRMMAPVLEVAEADPATYGAGVNGVPLLYKLISEFQPEMVAANPTLRMLNSYPPDSG